MPKQTTLSKPEAPGQPDMIDPDGVKLPLFVLRQAYLPTVTQAHRHACAQLIHAAQGVLEVVAEEGRWVVPPQRGVWIAPGKLHQVLSKKRFDLCTLYVSQALAQPLGQGCQVVQVSSLLSELLIKGASFGLGWQPGGAQERLLRVALEQVALDPLGFKPGEPLHLRHPTDKRAARICSALLADPANTTELKSWANTVGASERTLSRVFTQQTGLGFAQWRRQCRMLKAIEMLALGEPVTQVALQVGYGDMSAFARDFRKAFGVPPSAYFQ